MHAHIGRPEAVLDVRTVRVSGWAAPIPVRLRSACSCPG